MIRVFTDLAEEHKVDLVKGDVLQGFVGVGDVGLDPGLGPVQVAPVKQRGGQGEDSPSTHYKSPGDSEYPRKPHGGLWRCDPEYK